MRWNNKAWTKFKWNTKTLSIPLELNYEWVPNLFEDDTAGKGSVHIFHPAYETRLKFQVLCLEGKWMEEEDDWF